MSKFEDLTGMKFGRLTVQRRGDDFVCRNGKHRTQWVCLCDCGNSVTVLSFNLKRLNTKSCGCLNDESRMKNSTTHGGRHEHLYGIWIDIKSRCYNPNISNYENYGGRGIKMCDEWKESYDAFRTWAYQNGYQYIPNGSTKNSLSIDRINVDGDYEPGNCRWIDAKAQANNRRNTLYYDAFGERHTLSEWAEITGEKYHTLFARINKLNWTVERALTYSSSNLKYNNQ